MVTARAMATATTRNTKKADTFASYQVRYMLKFFQKDVIDLKVDIHSHLLPGLDDGVRSQEEALTILKFFESRGYEKVITTPHINPELFSNSEENILRTLQVMQEKISEKGMQIKLEAAAEYFIGKEFLQALEQQKEILTFGDRYVLIETSFFSKPIIFDEVIFKLKSADYIPVLAHPERYQYLANDITWLREIREKGVKLQLTLSSLVGMYGKEPKQLAERLLKYKMVDFLGSDIHRENQIELLTRALRKKVKPQKFLNNELIS